MVNYNTDQLKVAMYTATPDLTPMSGNSIRNMVAALTEAFDRMTNVVLVFAFCRHLLPARAGHEIHTTITSRGGEIASYHPAMVINTNQGKCITIHFIGGIGTFFVPAPDSSSDSDEAVAVMDTPSPVPPPRRRPRNNTRTNTRTNTLVADHAANNSSRGNINGSRHTNNYHHSSDSSFEDTIGLTQELF
jgi:hypothetical protein